MAYFTQQEYAVRTVRAAAILTNAYVAGTILGVASVDANQVQTKDQVDDWNYLALECAFTIGSLTDVQIKIEFSDDNVTYYQLGQSSVSSGVDTMTLGVLKLSATGNYYININKEYFNGGPFKTRYIKISSSGTGTVSGSSLAINAVVGTA